MANKLADLQSVVNFMMQNTVMQPPYPLHAAPIPAANAQKGGQKTTPVAPSTPGAKDTLTDLPGRSDEESQEEKNHGGRIAQRRQTPKDISMFSGRRCVSTQLMERDRRGLTTKRKVVHQKD